MHGGYIERECVGTWYQFKMATPHDGFKLKCCWLRQPDHEMDLLQPDGGGGGGLGRLLYQKTNRMEYLLLLYFLPPVNLAPTLGFSLAVQ